MKHRYDLSRDKWLHARSQHMAELGEVVFKRRVGHVEHWGEVETKGKAVEDPRPPLNSPDPAVKEAQRVSSILFKAKLSGKVITHPYRLVKRGLFPQVAKTEIYRGAVSLCCE